MSPAPFNWREKIKPLVGYPTKGWVPLLARAAKEKNQRAVYSWIEERRSPRDEADVLRRIADSFADKGVTYEWLVNGRDDAPRIVGAGIDATTIAKAQRLLEELGLPPAVRDLLLATTDERCRAFLVAQLAVYRTSVAPTAPSSRAR